MTQAQMVRVGEILNVSKIVVGDINVVFGQYQVDARVINVETGTIAATEGATFATSSYRSSMQSVAQKLAGKIAIAPGSTVPAQTSSSSSPKTRTSVETLWGYLKIFPMELGTFSSEPISVISNINAQVQYGYNNWRIPTNEELSILRANNYLGSGEYMSRENTSGKVLLVTDGKDYATLYVDLGLPSGTLWKDENEEGGFYTYSQAVKKFGNSLPTKEQLEELDTKCQWSWTGSGYKVVGPNGQSIYLPAAGYRSCSWDVYDVGSWGILWSSATSGSDDAWALRFYLDNLSNDPGKYVSDRNHKCDGLSVRLVQNP